MKKLLAILALFFLAALPATAQQIDAYGGSTALQAPTDTQFQVGATISQSGTTISVATSSPVVCIGDFATPPTGCTLGQFIIPQDCVFAEGTGNPNFDMPLPLGWPVGVVDSSAIGDVCWHVAGATDASHFTVTVVTSQAISGLSGAITKGHFHVFESNNRWWFADPFENAYFLVGAADVINSNDTIASQSTNGIAVRNLKYANTPKVGMAHNNQIYTWMLRFISLGINSIDEGSDYTAYAAVCGSSWPNGVYGAGGCPPPNIRMPFINTINFQTYVSDNVNNYIANGDAVKNLAGVIKWNVFIGYQKGWEDTFDPKWTQYHESSFANSVNGSWLLYAGPHHDYNQSVTLDEADNQGCFSFDGNQQGIIFGNPPTVGNPVSTLVVYPAKGGAHCGWEVLAASSVESASMCDTSAFNNMCDRTPPHERHDNPYIVYHDTVYHSKIWMENYLCGTTCGSPINETTGDSASGNGTTVTITGSFADTATHPVFPTPLYIPKEPVSITGCGAFNTAAGHTVFVSTSSTTQFTFTSSTSGSAAGCTVFDGPNYGTIAALDSAWSAGQGYTVGYDSFGSDATSFIDTLTSNGSQTQTFTLAHSLVTPETVQVCVGGTSGANCFAGGGTLYAGSDGYGARAKPATQCDTLWGPATRVIAFDSVTCVGGGSFLMDNTGAGQIEFASSSIPSSGTPIYISSQTGGWGAGHGLLDEDGYCPSKGASACWMTPTGLAGNGNAFYSLTTPSTSLTTGACISSIPAQCDLDGFLFMMTKNYASGMDGMVQTYFPGQMTADDIVIYQNTPRAQVAFAMAAYGNAITTSVPGEDYSGVAAGSGATMQQRIDALANVIGNKPYITTIYHSAQGDSPWAGNMPNINGPDFPTMTAEGQAYQTYMQQMLNYETTSGCSCSFPNTHLIIGLETWPGGMDIRNEYLTGLFSTRDDMYDGKQDTMNFSVDMSDPANPYPAGCLGADAPNQPCNTANYSDLTDYYKFADSLWKAFLPGTKVNGPGVGP